MKKEYIKQSIDCVSTTNNYANASTTGSYSHASTTGYDYASYYQMRK